MKEASKTEEFQDATTGRKLLRTARALLDELRAGMGELVAAVSLMDVALEELLRLDVRADTKEEER